MDVVYSSWADQVAEEDKVISISKNKKQKLERKPHLKESQAERDAEIFVGNLRFDDLDQLREKTAIRFRMRNERKMKILTMFERYGEISSTRPHWRKGFLFIVFKEASTAQEVVLAMESLEVRDIGNEMMIKERKKLTKNLKQELKTCGMFPQSAPNPNFYVRPSKQYHPTIPSL
eukprot:TRINITY_DN1032_c0_g1_i3.p1 TRINITY_DN1032_c0_g1~~TRINITY_DN1032_c0_g1_i3.p1  ORF type:complete len:175 (-),score=42.70 TRINITY_DN1032_c0_g1_i3:60-584(-)